MAVIDNGQGLSYDMSEILSESMSCKFFNRPPCSLLAIAGASKRPMLVLLIVKYMNKITWLHDKHVAQCRR